jgi:hypothetical protein
VREAAATRHAADLVIDPTEEARVSKPGDGDFDRRVHFTEDSARALSCLKRFGSVSVLNGHIHQVPGLSRISFHGVTHPLAITGAPLEDEMRTASTRRARTPASARFIRR